MQFLTDTKIDFMKYRSTFIWVSVALLLIAFAELFFMTGLNLGIDFAGGTQLTLALREPSEVDTLRKILADAGMREAQIQRYGEAEDQQVLIKTPVAEKSEEGSGKALIDALHAALNSGAPVEFDLNRRGREALSGLLATENPENVAGDQVARTDHYAEVTSRILDRRDPLFRSWDDLDAVEMSDEVRQLLKEKTFLGAFHEIQIENVGPQIGGELRSKGLLAVILSLAGMLLYIWYRFELRFGVGALIAVFHDFVITLGLYALANYEFNLPTIAAFLTLVGYSVNDTVVIFDRVRENMRRDRRKPLVEVMNESLNQTLSRTILTSGTTLVAVASLFVLGGEVIRGFAFVMLIGVIIGTYSSVFIASPFTLLWERYFGTDSQRKSSS